MKRIVFFSIIAMVILLAARAGADKIYFKDGKVIEGRIIAETDEDITVEMFSGTDGTVLYTPAKEDIDKIEEGEMAFPGEKKDAPKKESAGILSIVKDMISNFSKGGGIKIDDLSWSKAWREIETYIFTSFFISVLVDLLLLILIFYSLRMLKAGEGAIILEAEKLSRAKAAGRCFFVVGTLVLSQGVRFGNYNFFTAGYVSILMLVVIIYETIGFFIVLISKNAYVGISRRIFSGIPLVFKLIIAGEFLLFCYMFIMDLLELF